MDNIELTQPSIRYLQTPLLRRNLRGKFEDVSRRSGWRLCFPRLASGKAKNSILIRLWGGWNRHTDASCNAGL